MCPAEAVDMLFELKFKYDRMCNLLLEQRQELERNQKLNDMYKEGRPFCLFMLLIWLYISLTDKEPPTYIYLPSGVQLPTKNPPIYEL